MKQPCRQCGSPPRSSPSGPAWADPRALMATAAYRVTVVAMPAGDVVLVARADPLRIAIGFSRAVLGVTDFRVAPAAMPAAFGWVLNFNATVVWFPIFDFGPMVNDQWNGNCSGADTLAVTEVYRLN